MSLKQISAEEANDIINNDSSVIYIDVRTEQEFANGHVPKAINIPVVWPDQATRQMLANPDFVKVVSAHLGKDKKIIVGCQAGGRSQYAGQLLVQEGFQDVSNMQGGFGGARDPMGRVVLGWNQLGFPIETEVPANASYASLKNA